VQNERNFSSIPVLDLMARRMKNQHHEKDLYEQVWRRALPPTEAAVFRANLEGRPADQADFDLETALTSALDQLSDVPVSSNFTSRVLATVDRKLAAERRRRWSWHRLWRARWRWMPQAGLAFILLTGGFFSYTQVQTAQRVKTVESLSTVAEVVAVPGPELLRDFEAIRALSPAPGADVELLALLPDAPEGF
jgi:anti-sigma factor RsiW